MKDRVLSLVIVVEAQGRGLQGRGLQGRGAGARRWGWKVGAQWWGAGIKKA